MEYFYPVLTDTARELPSSYSLVGMTATVFHPIEGVVDQLRCVLR